jgi:hypothetical protein
LIYNDWTKKKKKTGCEYTNKKKNRFSLISQKIGASIGIVEHINTDAEGIGWGKFLRVKILLDLKKPLPRGRKINIDGTITWITFQYERLPKFCFQCEVISHGKMGCPKRSGLHQQEQNQYGPWLRAASPPRRVG